MLWLKSEAVLDFPLVCHFLSLSNMSLRAAFRFLTETPPVSNTLKGIPFFFRDICKFWKMQPWLQIKQRRGTKRDDSSHSGCVRLQIKSHDHLLQLGSLFSSSVTRPHVFNHIFKMSIHRCCIQPSFSCSVQITVVCTWRA